MGYRTDLFERIWIGLNLVLFLIVGLLAVVGLALIGLEALGWVDI